MSGYRTHMLIGAVGGVLLTQTPLPQVISHASPLGGWLTPQLAACGICVTSAVLATWPDIDEPGSWMARRLHALLMAVGTLLGVGIGALVSWHGGMPIWIMAVTTLSGMVLGSRTGWLVLRAVRIGAGGHRHLTHSLILVLVLFIIACTLWGAELHGWAGVPAGLAWGILWHLIGDVVTPGGVDLLYPLSPKRYRLLPRSVARHGERLVAVVAVVVLVVLVVLVVWQ